MRLEGNYLLKDCDGHIIKPKDRLYEMTKIQSFKLRTKDNKLF